MFKRNIVNIVLGVLLLTMYSEAIKIPGYKSEKQKAKEKIKKEEAYKSEWEKFYGESDDDIANGIVALEEGHSALVGTCQSFGAKRTDICVTRMNEKGEMVWRLMLGGEKEDTGRAITRAADGSLFILGTTKSLSKNYDKDIYAAKVTLDGKLVWEKAIGGNRDEHAGGIAGTDDGGVLIVGDTESIEKRYKDIYIVKLDKDGQSLVSHTIGGEKSEEAHSLARMKDGHFALVGMREMSNGNYADFFVMKLDQNGKYVWTKTFGGTYNDSLHGVTGTVDGGFVAVGKTRSYKSEQTDLTVMKFSAEGKLLWHKIYGFKYYEYGNAVTGTKDGGFMIVGGTNTLGQGGHSVYLLALDKTGKLIWSHVYGGRNHDAGHGIARMSDGSLIVAGESDSFDRSRNFYMLKIQQQKLKNK
ncbi:PQQ-binding-like beta-propeller repeat protein [Sulfurovum sp.]|uniref:PQQ-binding-like beta-propeller repeat protein n=1 Tax=Sulfurovum sp. TaxID=1969726 RepID=UPI0028682E64|nr:PQQ-binding-like beta-propeller repeat protein [Sulfurovum sp.]